ncbi:MAG: efflux RND transporter periplasmic adaptor subunit [Deltaproteobacteria bacterium]|nr:efflux RND transporter periplasmic adaptor subunit [Deltaproteobacteria bacterium]
MTSKRARGFGWARRLGNTLLGVGVTTLLLALAYVGLTSDLGPQDGDLPSHLNAVPVERGILRELVIANGSLEPSARVVVQSEIPGIVAYVHVDNGDRVEPGQPLVELDRERLEDRVAEPAAALAERRARARVDLVGRAELELRKARRDLERVEGLHAQGIASRETLELEEYRAALAEIGLGDAHAEKAARRASVREAENALRRMRRDVEKSIIRSPIGGVVVRRHVEVGTAVADLQNGGTVVVTLADDRRLHVLAEVDENDVAAVRVGQRVEVRIDAFPDEPLEGQVRKVSSAGRAEGSVASFEVEIELTPDPRARVGMSADTRIQVESHADVLLVPNNAIDRDGDGPRVRRGTGEGGEAEWVRIEEGASDGFHTVVQAGLEEGDTVLLEVPGSAG